MQVVIRVPKTTPPKSGFPVLIAFHGRGESLKGPARGARGWLDDYKLARAAGRLLAPPLRSTDFEGLVTKKRLEQLNSGLQRHPYRDLIVMMPFLPDRFGRGQLFANAPLMADVVVGQLLPRLRREGAGVADLSRVGIDGVSLGGRVSLVLGLTHPQVFHTVGGVQAALDETELDQLVSMAQAAHKQNPDLKLRLLTSHEDYYLDVNREFSGRLDHNGVRHRLLISSGNHSYQFNRGPGAIEMLLFHSRQL
jgi:iron(III)-salmochelin esterase